jgi:hypothetical protein
MDGCGAATSSTSSSGPTSPLFWREGDQLPWMHCRAFDALDATAPPAHPRRDDDEPPLSGRQPAARWHNKNCAHVNGVLLSARMQDISANAAVLNCVFRCVCKRLHTNLMVTTPPGALCTRSLVPPPTTPPCSLRPTQIQCSRARECVAQLPGAGSAVCMVMGWLLGDPQHATGLPQHAAAAAGRARVLPNDAPTCAAPNKRSLKACSVAFRLVAPSVCPHSQIGARRIQLAAPRHGGATRAWRPVRHGGGPDSRSAGVLHQRARG